MPIVRSPKGFEFPPTWYRARPLNVVDGDTIDVEIDVGFHSVRTERLRILGVNTPELHAKDPAVRAAAQVAKDFTTNWLATAAASLGPMAMDPSGKDRPLGWSLMVRTEKTDAFGRYLAQVMRDIQGVGQADLGVALLDTKNAIPFNG